MKYVFKCKRTMVAVPNPNPTVPHPKKRNGNTNTFQGGESAKSQNQQ